MNTQDIIKSLSNLEHSLQGVESARQQVDSTVAAYGATQKQLATLSQEFVKVSTELSKVIDVVRNNQEQLSATLSSKIEHLLIQIEGKVAVLGNKASLMNQAFESSCTETAKSINDSIDAAIASFKGKVKDELSEVSSALAEFSSIIKDIQEGFQKDASQAISTLQETSEKVVTGFQEKIANHLSSLSKLNNELEAIVNLQKKQNAEILTKFERESASIKASISNIDSQLKGMKNNNDEHHKELIEVLSAILQGNSPSAERLTARINTVDGNIGAVKDGVSSVSSQLGTATNQIIDHNKQALLSEVTDVKAENASIKKLLIFCLIVTIISMILNIMMLFH